MWYEMWYSENRMQLRELRKRIKQLKPNTPHHLRLAHVLQEGAGFGGAWYLSQKEHWLGWLREYDGPGAYGRKVVQGRDARFVYNHGQCAPMLFWLAEASGVDHETLQIAFQAVVSAPSRNASQCGELRKTLPWELVETHLLQCTIAGDLGVVLQLLRKRVF